jgi:hypothetical protein
MRILQHAMEQALHGLPQHVLSELITQKLAAQGVKLSARERKLLAEHVLKGGKDTLRFRRWQWWEHDRQIRLNFTPQGAEQIEQKFTSFIEKRLPDLIDVVVEDLSGKILIDLNRTWRAESHRQRRELAEFKKRLHDRWELPLEGLRMLLTISRDLGDSINQEIRQSPDPSRKHLVEVLTRSHARACQVTEEIICLLEGGFADGAMARWRTLHELAVVSFFVAAHGEDLAERYVLHQVVESNRAAADYQKCQSRLGYEPMQENEIKALQRSYDKVIARFGSAFGGQYGWAAEHLKVAKPNFEQIEQSAGIGHLRAHYRMASHNVHANPKGVFFKLGLLHQSQLLLACPSNAGLADPGHCAALSLAQVSTVLGRLEPTLDNIVALHIIAQLVSELGGLFGQAHQRLADDASEITGIATRNSE